MLAIVWLMLPLVACGLALSRPTATSDFELLRRSSGGGGPRVVFVGGNPGVARYYDAAAAALADQLDGDVAVLGLRGFFEGGGRPLRWWRDAWRWCRGRAEGCFSVDEQAASVTALVAAEAAACAASGRKLVVVGHSIGGYLALRALKASGADGVSVCVQPYLENNYADPEFEALRKLLEKPWAPLALAAVASFATFLGVLPRAARRPVLRALGQTDGMDAAHEAMTCDAMCAFGNVFSMAALGRSEMRSLAGPYEGPWPDALLVADEPRDKWSPASGPLVDRARAGGSDVAVVSGVPHAFSTAPASRSAVVAAIAAKVRELT